MLLSCKYGVYGSDVRFLKIDPFFCHFCEPERVSGLQRRAPHRRGVRLSAPEADASYLLLGKRAPH